MRAATVVLPTPPLPIVITTPLPGVGELGRRARRGARRGRPAVACGGSRARGSALGVPIWRSASMPTSPKGSSGTSTRGSPRRPAGSASSDARPRASMATAVASLASRAWNTPFRISRTLRDAELRELGARALRLRERRASRAARRAPASSAPDRAAPRWTRRTAPSARSSPESGPRHDVPPTFVSMKLVHAAGSSSRRSVCPVGAVSKMTWSNSAVAPRSPSSFENSSNAAISTVHAPESCSSMLATATAGSTPRYGPDDALAVVVRRLLGVDVQRREAGHVRHRRRRRRELHAEHLVEVRGRVGADEQHALARVGEADGRRAGRGGLADAALAREEEDARRIPDQCGHGLPFSSSRTSSGSRLRPRTRNRSSRPTLPWEGPRRRPTRPARRATGTRRCSSPRRSPSRAAGPLRPSSRARPSRPRPSAKAAGCCARLKRSTETPWPSSQSRSAAKRTSCGSTDGPQIPVEQHMAGSKTRTAVMGFSFGSSASFDCHLGRFKPWVANLNRRYTIARRLGSVKMESPSGGGIRRANAAPGVAPYGQVGTTTPEVPTQVVELGKNVAHVSAGGAHTWLLPGTRARSAGALEGGRAAACRLDAVASCTTNPGGARLHAHLRSDARAHGPMSTRRSAGQVDQTPLRDRADRFAYVHALFAREDVSRARARPSWQESSPPSACVH